MRVAIISGSVPTTTFIDNLINVMAEEGFEMTVIGKKNGEHNYGPNVKTIIVPSGFLSRIVFIKWLVIATGFQHFWKILANSKGLKDWYHNLLFYMPIIYAKPDRVHIQWTAYIHNRDLLFRIFKDKVLVSMRGAHINYTPITRPEIKASYLKLFPLVRRFHAVSEAIAKEAEKYGANKERTDVIYSFVNDELLKKEIIPKTTKSHLHIISVGRFFWKKGYEYALDTLFQLKQRGVRFKYTLIAQGDTPQNIIYQIHQLGLQNDVEIINGLKHTEVLEKIEEHDVLLLPSVEEGIANVALEAMAIGTPVITTDVGGMKEVIEPLTSGYIVHPRDLQSMVDALIKFQSLNHDERFAIAIAAKEKIQSGHNSKIFKEKFAAFYRK